MTLLPFLERDIDISKLCAFENKNDENMFEKIFNNMRVFFLTDLFHRTHTHTQKNEHFIFNIQFDANHEH